MEGYDFSNDLMLKVYPSFSYYASSKNMGIDDMIVAARSMIGTLHVVLRDGEIITFQEHPDGTYMTRENVISAPSYYDFNIKTPTFVSDIINSDIYQSKLHTENNQYTRVVCFDEANAYSGAYIYYIGTERTIVRTYKNHSEPAVDLLLEDFQLYSAAYYADLKANPGQIGCAGVYSFIENYTVEEAQEIYEQSMAKLEKENEANNKEENKEENLPAGTEPENTGNTQNENPKNTADKDGGTNILIWIIPTAAAVVLLGGAIAFIALRKKKNEL